MTNHSVVVSIKFKGKEEEAAFIVSGYKVDAGIVQLHTYNGVQTKIQIFPLTDIEEINVNEVLV